MDTMEEAIRQEVCCLLDRELTDAAWQVFFGQAKNKLRFVIGRYGDGDGKRRKVGYIAQLVIEAIRAEGLRRQLDEKKAEADTMADPQGHIHILPQNGPDCQAIFA